MTVHAWLEARRPAPPTALADRVRDLVASVPDEDEPAAACLRAAEQALARLVREGDAGRAQALDLLAIDALVTYAFEAAADHPDTIGPRAHAAMAALSRVGQP